MNEVNKIHLGRQAFTISVDAHHELRHYLDAIKDQIKDKDVIDEIELRMAELLTEHGLNNDKVILPADVDYLKEQLGNPTDFKEDEEDSHPVNSKQSTSKKLFRDSENAMVAGVAAGLAEYFGLDVLLIRILFVILAIISLGWGILLYILLWLLVPEAKTTSDRLQMAGKPITVDSLKDVIERADIKGAAHRANATFASPINALFRVILKVIGLVFVILGLGTLFGLITVESYFLFHGGNWLQYNIFPIGFREHFLLDATMIVIALIASIIILFGIAIFRRKWPIRTWVTGILIGLIFIGLAVGGSLAADVYPNVRDRYNANVHTFTRSVQPFTSIDLTGPSVNINFANSDAYYVSLNYYDHPNLSSIITNVKNGTLIIDSSQFNWHRNCRIICIPNSYNMNITIYSPITMQLENQLMDNPKIPPVPAYQ